MQDKIMQDKTLTDKISEQDTTMSDNNGGSWKMTDMTREDRDAELKNPNNVR